MFPTSISGHFVVRQLAEGDLAQILDLCRGNPLFYRYCPPSPSAESIREDMKSLPPGVEPENKFYLGLRRCWTWCSIIPKPGRLLSGSL